MPLFSLRLLEPQDPKGADLGGLPPEDEERKAALRGDAELCSARTPVTTQTLPPEIQELRQKLTEKNPVRVQPALLATSVDRPSMAERAGFLRSRLSRQLRESPKPLCMQDWATHSVAKFDVQAVEHRSSAEPYRRGGWRGGDFLFRLVARNFALRDVVTHAISELGIIKR